MIIGEGNGDGNGVKTLQGGGDDSGSSMPSSFSAIMRSVIYTSPIDKDIAVENINP